MDKITIRQMGNSDGITLPKDIMKSLNIKRGESLFIREKDGEIVLSKYDPGFDKRVDAMMRSARKFPNAMKKLAE